MLWGDPSGPRLWSDLDGVLNGTWGDLPVRAVAVDTGGHHTKMAYEFCRTRLTRRIWAIKGRGGPGIPVWPRRPTRTNKGKIPLFIAGAERVKTRGKWRTVELLACPITWRPHPEQIASARRAYED